jgi:uncharacterized protein (PEP-CTERM system associated)
LSIPGAKQGFAVTPRLVCLVLGVLSYLVLGYLMVMPTRATEYIITPSITLCETYDDNVYFRDIDDFEHPISPALKMDAKTKTGEWQAECAWDIVKYQRHDELDSVDQAYGLSASTAASPLLQLNIAGRYTRDYTFASTLEESGLVAERSERNTITVQPRAAIIMTPRNTLEFSYQFNRTEYDLESYPDYVSHDPNLTWFHDLMNERTGSYVCWVEIG